MAILRFLAGASLGLAMCLVGSFVGAVSGHADLGFAATIALFYATLALSVWSKVIR